MPPKSKKKAAKNAFWFFAMEWKKEQESQGQRFKDLNEVTRLCSADWNRLPENRKSVYKAMEQGAKQANGGPANKFNALGVSFDEIERQKNEEIEARQTMYKDIDSILGSLTQDNSGVALKKHFFYLVHVNTYCYWGFKQVFIPCEVAITKFNLQDGVVDCYHVFPAPVTDTGDLPVGYKFEALQNAKTVHDIPLPSEWDKTEFDWRKISGDILKFLIPHEGAEIPPLFTMDGASVGGSNINCEMRAVKNFFDAVSDFTGKEFRVYSIGLFFYKLYAACQNVAVNLFGYEERAFPVEGVAHQQLTRDIYNYCSGIACPYHETTDMFHNCSLSFVKRWVFLICEFCCKALKISLIPNHHCISNADIAALVSESPPISLSDQRPSRTRVLYPPPEDPSVHIVTSGNSDGWNTAMQRSVSPNDATGGDYDSSSSEGWSTISRAQPKVRTAYVNDRMASGRNPENPTTVDTSKASEPSRAQILRTGQSVSEIMPDTAGPSVRLPTTKGRGELMAEMSRQYQASPGASFPAEDFPAIGGARPGYLAKPMAKGWGRGFLKPE